MSEIDVSKCEYYNKGTCERYEELVEGYYNDFDVKCECDRENCFGDYDICDYMQLQQLKAENEKLERLIAKQKNAKIQLSKLKDNQYKEFCDMKQCLDEIEEISKGCAEDNGLITQDEGYFIIIKKIKEVKGND